MWHQVVARHLIMTQLSRILRASVEDGSLDVDSEMTVVSSRRVVTKSHYMPLEAKDIFNEMMEKGFCVHDISERGCNRYLRYDMYLRRTTLGHQSVLAQYSQKINFLPGWSRR